MRVLVQRCDKALVRVNDNVVGSINKGLMILVGFTEGDNFDTIKCMADKIVNLRVFDDENGIMNKSILDKSYSILSVSQFTLYGDASKGRRPSYVNALNGSLAKPLYDKFNEELRKHGVEVETGSFGADMKVELINDGPVTIMLER
jgi:D-tyrosyl-tRNA(Tyr) deacylase